MSSNDLCKKVCELCPGDRIGTFGWADILLFVIVLAISTAIGVFYLIRESRALKKATPDDILMGGRDIGMFPIAMSMMASFMSAITVLGTPTEMYNNNTSFWIASWAMVPTAIVTNQLFLPFFHNLNITSAYEYLEKRFNRPVRVLASLLFLLNSLLFMGVVLYAPALALNSVTGLNLELCIAIIGIICTFYTALGGLRAVVWTDTFQTFIVLAGLVAVAVQGSIEVGGAEKVWNIAIEKGRMVFFDWDPDPTVRHSVWSLLIGSWVGQLTIYAANQTMIQRYLAIKNIKNSERALYFSIPPTLLLSCLVCFVGLVIFAVYHDCDPYILGHVKARDQLLPFLVMDKLTFLPGLAGLFVASLFSAALSSISSGLNALSTVFLEDILKLVWEAREWTPSPTFLNRTAKVLGLICGASVMGIAFLARLLGQTVLQIVLSIFGVSGGPLLGLFISGIFMPFINAWGALAGLILSTLLAFWAGVGGILILPFPAVHNVTIDACGDWAGVLRNCSVSETTISSIINSTIAEPSVEPKGQDFWIYHISYLWYALYAVLISVITGILVTFITSTCLGFNTPQDVKSNLIHPGCDRMCCFLPLSCANVDRESKPKEGRDNPRKQRIIRDSGHTAPWDVNDSEDDDGDYDTDTSEDDTNYVDKYDFGENGDVFDESDVGIRHGQSLRQFVHMLNRDSKSSEASDALESIRLSRLMSTTSKDIKDLRHQDSRLSYESTADMCDRDCCDGNEDMEMGNVGEVVINSTGTESNNGSNVGSFVEGRTAVRPPASEIRRGGTSDAKRKTWDDDSDVSGGCSDGCSMRCCVDSDESETTRSYDLTRCSEYLTGRVLYTTPDRQSRAEAHGDATLQHFSKRRSQAVTDNDAIRTDFSKGRSKVVTDGDAIRKDVIKRQRPAVTGDDEEDAIRQDFSKRRSQSLTDNDVTRQDFSKRRSKVLNDGDATRQNFNKERSQVVTDGATRQDCSKGDVGMKVSGTKRQNAEIVRAFSVRSHQYEEKTTRF